MKEYEIMIDHMEKRRKERKERRKEKEERKEMFLEHTGMVGFFIIIVVSLFI